VSSAFQGLQTSYPWSEVKRFARLAPIRFDAVLLAVVWALFLPSWEHWALGLGWWFVAEYWLHRRVLHGASPFSSRHWAHHRDPEDERWWPVPPAWTLELTAGAAVGFMGTAGWRAGGGMLGGFLSGLLYFEWCHFVAHHAVTPWSAVGRWIKRRHLEHHYVNETVWYGISPGAGGLDWVFGTGPRNTPPFHRAEAVRRPETPPSPFWQWWERLPADRRQALESEAARWWLLTPGLSVVEMARRREALGRQGVAWQRALEAWCVQRGLWAQDTPGTEQSIQPKDRR
jgi:4-hydroxysphinganine ceramide fatty acyl 2-hydroxylase